MNQDNLETNSAVAAATPTAEAAPKTNAAVNDVKQFFKQDFTKIIKLIFTEPIKGTLSVFTNTTTDAYKHALILIISTVLLYTIVPYLMVGSSVRSYVGIGVFLKLGLSVGLVLLIISSLSFGVKAISGKPDFKRELLTGGLCGIPMSLLVLVIAVVVMFNADSFSLYNPRAILDQGIFASIIFLYLVLMMFNIVQQSFKSSGTNDALSWYLSPLVICVGFYIGVKIAMALFTPAGISPF